MKVDSDELRSFRALVVDLKVQWQMFDQLFLRDSNYVIFNRVGRNFWYDLQNLLTGTILQSISRFFDPAGNKHQTNLSLAAVVLLPEVASIRSELDARLAGMRPIWQKGIAIWRHKKLSHSDRPTALGKATLPQVAFTDIENLVSGISEFARFIDVRLNNIDVSYQIAVSNWVPEVLGYLKDGIERRDQKASGVRD